MMTIEITKCDNFGREILHVLGSTLTLVVRSKTKYGRGNAKNGIEISLRI